MNLTRVSTESPNSEQWRIISQYSYPSNIRRYMKHHGYEEIQENTIELIAGSIRQSQAFFDAAATSPLDVSPLLLYYGATSLLMAASTMFTNTVPLIQNHGMRISPNPYTRLADVNITPISPDNGALQLFSNIFSRGCNLVGSRDWSLGEIMSSIPDLKQDFENQYLDLISFTVPVEIVQTRELIFERIYKKDLSRYPNAQSVMSLIDNFQKAYLPFQDKSNHVILFRRPKGIDIGNYSITGRKFLSLGHQKKGKLLSPDQIILMYMGLYVLGFLPRYHPHLWNPFVRTDQTGEKIIVEKFIAICKRYLPNLILNFLSDSQMQFVNETEGVLDMTKTVSTDEIKDIVKKTLEEIRATGK